MEVTIYRLVGEHETYKTDMDGVAYLTYEVFVRMLFPTNESAMRKAESLQNKQVCYVRIYEVIVTESGREIVKNIYKKYNGKS